MTAAALLCASSLSHAVVIFGSGQAITGDTSDLLPTAIADTFLDQTSGTAITDGFSGVGAGDPTTGGITAAQFEGALDTVNFAAAAATITIELTGLDIGTSYDVQFFFNDERFGGAFTPNGGQPRTVTIDDGAGNTFTLNNTQFVTGTFEATAQTQDFAITGGTNGSGNFGPHINLVTFAETVPEPSSALLLGLGGLALGLRRRR